MKEEAMLKKIAQLIKESENRLEAVMDKKIGSLQVLMMQGFGIMDTRFDQLEARIDKVEINHGARIRALENKIQ